MEVYTKFETLPIAPLTDHSSKGPKGILFPDDLRRVFFIIQ